MKKISFFKLSVIITLLIFILFNIALLLYGRQQYRALSRQRQRAMDLEQQLKKSQAIWQRNSDCHILLFSPFWEEVDRRLASPAVRQGVAAMIAIDGDKVGLLQQISHATANDFVHSSVKIMQKRFPENEYNVVGCLGEMGDEFYIFVSGRNSRDELISEVKQILREIRKIEIHANGETFHNSCSVGIAFLSRKPQPFEELFTQADQALSQAKKNGKDTYFVYGASSAPERETPPHNPEFLMRMIEKSKANKK